MAIPGNGVKLRVSLGRPIALADGDRFAVREGGMTVPIEQRAESTVIAWLRHQTTAYESTKIARVNGKRREVRCVLAEQSRRLLEG